MGAIKILKLETFLDFFFCVYHLNDFVMSKETEREREICIRNTILIQKKNKSRKSFFEQNKMMRSSCYNKTKIMKVNDRS